MSNTKFKVGDKVRVINSNYLGKYPEYRTKVYQIDGYDRYISQAFT